MSDRDTNTTDVIKLHEWCLQHIFVLNNRRQTRGPKHRNKLKGFSKYKFMVNQSWHLLDTQFNHRAILS